MDKYNDLIAAAESVTTAMLVLLDQNTGLRNAMTCACNALADSTDANTLLWVAKMRKFLRDGE